MNLISTSIFCIGLALLPLAAFAQSRIVQAQGYRVQLDLSHQVLHLTVPEDRTYGASRGGVEATISPTLAPLAAETPEFMSAAVLAQKAKQFDDGLYAAVDLAAEHGSGRFAGKAYLLRSLCAELARSDVPNGSNVEPVLAGAAKLGNVPAGVTPAMDAAVQEFLSNPLLSKPVGFYTWSPELRAIFQQDRMLQSELKGQAGIAGVAGLLHSDPKLRAIYEQYLELTSRLTNPLVPEKPDLRNLLKAMDRGQAAAPERNVYFFPPSMAAETELIKKLYGSRPIPEGFSLVDEMIRQIQAGTVSLKPTAASGWYARQVWSLEPLVVPGKTPEAGHLELDPSYQKLLLDLFKGLLTLTRETHIKQLEMPMVGDAMRPRAIDIEPELSAEPLSTFYLRRAQAYHFVGTVIDGTFGPEAASHLHRLTAAGPVTMSLADELKHMQSLFYGAAVTVNRQLGMADPAGEGAGSGAGADADAARFKGWSAALSKDPDVGQDARAMVPVFYDVKRKKTKVWVFLGWDQRPLWISFATPPEGKVLDEHGAPAERAPRLDYQPKITQVISPVTAEVYVDKILDRAEFRKLCDTYKTRTEILKHLE